MRLATWNVNSIRARVDRVLALLERSDIDVLAMQETKCRPDQFPVDSFEDAGYQVSMCGLNQWNGVAIASRVGLDDVETSFPGQPGFGDPEPIVEARAIGATCAGMRVWSVYVPNGRGLDDPHFAYKLDFLSSLRNAAVGWAVENAPVAIVGDWNVAPLDSDAWDPADPEIATHVSPSVREAFSSFKEAGYVEASRRIVPDEHRYTYWDYQRLRFPRNEGLRIDHVLVSGALADRVVGGMIDREERKGKGASDHVPIIVDFADDPGSVLS
jgi:exodeoxyribonuclease-3